MKYPPAKAKCPYCECPYCFGIGCSGCDKDFARLWENGEETEIPPNAGGNKMSNG